MSSYAEQILQELRLMRQDAQRSQALIERLVDSRERTVSWKVFMICQSFLCLVIGVLGLHIIDAKKLRVQNYEIEITSANKRNGDLPSVP